MANNFFSLCCCSCCGLISSSPPQSPQQEAISSPLLSPQEQAIARDSTSSSPSQPSFEEEAVAGPSTATMTDLNSFLQKVNDTRKLQKLIQFLEEILKIASGERSEEGSSSAVSSCIHDGQRILEMVDKLIGKHPETEDSKDGASAEIEKVVINLLKDAGKIHWVGAALSVVGFVLATYSQMSNKRECLENLKVIVDLGKQILELNDQMPDQKQKLNEAIECSMCASQHATAEIFRFLTASINDEGFQAKMDYLYKDLTLSGIIDIQKRLPKIAYKPADFPVGIESGLKSVIQLLDLNAQHTSAQVVVVYGFGGIGKTTLADAIYDQIDHQTYKKCRIHMDQNCTENDLKDLQEQILQKLFTENLKLNSCDEGRGWFSSIFKKNPNQPLFLYIDNALKSTDLEQLLPEDLGSCLPPKSRILVTSRNLHETDIFVDRNIQRQQYAVSPLPKTEARKILLKKVWDYNDEKNIHDLLELCRGVPLLLEIAGSQLAISIKNANNIEVLEMIREGEVVEEDDISDRMVDFVYSRLSESVQEAFLDITSFFSSCRSEEVAYIVGEEEFRALEEASFVKSSEDGCVLVHEIVQARGKKMSEQNRITDPEALLDCLKDEEKLKNLKGIFFYQKHWQPPIEINDDHLQCMSNSLRVLSYDDFSRITFGEKCHKPFKQLRYLVIPSDIPDLPMEFEELEHITYYNGPFTQGMSLYEFPPSLHVMHITDSSKNGVAYFKTPPKVTPPSSVVELCLYDFKKMERLPDGVEKLTKLEVLFLSECHQLRQLPSQFGKLSNLKLLSLFLCNELKELPSDFGQLSNLESLYLNGCSALSVLPSSFGNLISLKDLQLICCSCLKKLPSNIGKLKNLEKLNLSHCYGLEEWPLSFGDLTKMKKMDLTGCSSKLKESLPHNIRGICSIVFD